MMCAFLVIYLLLSVKIAYYQVVRGYEIARQAAAMRSKQIELKECQRGEILDRNLLPLTSTSTSAAVYCLPQEIGNDYPGETSARQSFNKVADFLARVLLDEAEGDGKSKEKILACLNEATRLSRPFVRIASDLTEQQIQEINASNLSGIIVAPVIKRYREDGFCSHLLGYVGGNEGKAGLEKEYDEILKYSSSSPELTSVLDARGAVIQGLMFKVKKEEEKQKGTVVLTIDKRVQEIVENALSGRVDKGAVVVMDVRSKEILAMASRPAFNPYRVKEIVENDEKSTLSNRALSRYHPGSLFKILVAAAALEEGAVAVDDCFNCTGAYKFNDEVSISCWKEEGHGQINFVEAFALSCNSSFIEVGLKLKRDKLLEYAGKFHITDEKVIGYDDYNAGTYVKINPGEPALGNACLGQQGVMLTPLQVASLVATIADDGRWGPPSLVRYTIDREGKKNILPESSKKQVISKETAGGVKRLMETVVSEGTGKSAALSEVKVAGKTGTSQTGVLDENGKEILNTWFAGYFPADNPRWAIVVLVEGGKSGAEDAAPVFKEIAKEMLKYFSVTG